MNIIYKVIWNASLSIWIAVSEFAKGHIKAKNKDSIQCHSKEKNKSNIFEFKIKQVLFTSITSLFFMSSTMAVQTISTTGSGEAIRTSTSTAGETLGNYSNWNNPYSGNTLGFSGMYAIAIGDQSNAGNGSIVVGGQSNAVGVGNIILGNFSIATNNSSIIIGGHAYSTGLGSIVMGRDAAGLADQAIAIGAVSTASGVKSIALGHSAVASGLDSLALGSATLVGSQWSTTGAQATGDYSIAVGGGATSSSLNSVALGVSSTSNKDNAVALGANSNTNTNAVASTVATLNGLTYSGFAGSVGSDTGMQVSVGSAGNERQIKNVGSGVISNTSTDAINGSQLYATNSVLGNAANSTKNIIGGNAALNANGTISVTNLGGTGQTTIDAALITAQANAEADNTTLANNVTSALGGGATYNATTGVWTAPSYQLTDLTTGASSTVNNAGAAISQLNTAVNTPLTFKDSTTGISTNKLGSTFTYIGDDNIAAVVTQGQLALTLNKNLTGLTSVETTDGAGNSSVLGVTGTTVTNGANTTLYGANGLNINDGDVVLSSAGLNAGGVKVSSTGIDANNQAISNVADGLVEENSKQVVNGGQLFEVQSTLDSVADAGTTLANNVASALGGGASYDATTGVWTAPSYQLTNLTTGASSTVNNAGAAISQLNTAVNTPLTFKDSTTGISTNKLGSTFTYIGDDNIAAVVTQGQLALTLNKNLTGLTSVETVDDDGNSAVLGVTGTKVTDGTNTTLYGANGLNINDGDVVLSSAGLNAGGVKVSSTGIDANNQSITNVANAVNAGDATNLGQVESLITSATDTITNKGFSLQAEDGQTVSKKLGEAVEVVGDNKNISTEVVDGKIAVVLAKDLVVDSINAGGSVLDSTGLTVGDTKITSDGIFITDGPSLSTSGIDAGNKTISNVADAVLASDAINKGQFDTAINTLTESLGDLTESSVQYDRNEDGTVNKNSITLGGEDGTLITNIANGTVETGSLDAVNGGQLADVRDNLQGQITNNGNNLIELRSSLESGTIGLVQQQESEGVITIANETGGLSIDFSGTSGARVLTGIQAGSIAQDSTDAVTGSQLNSNYEALANSLGGNAKFENGVWTGPSYTVGYGDDAKIVNNVGDAVSALNDADQVLSTRIDNMGTQFDEAIKSTNDRIDRLTNKTNAAVAAAIAIASLPQPTEYGNTMLAVGSGVWEGEAGFSIGASGITKERRIFNSKPVNYVWKFATTTNSRGVWGGGASVGIQWK